MSQLVSVEKMSLQEGDLLIFWYKGGDPMELSYLDLPKGVTGYAINADLVSRIDRIPCEDAKLLLRNILRMQSDDGPIPH